MLTEAQSRRILKCYYAGDKFEEIAVRVGCAISSIYRIVEKYEASIVEVPATSDPART